MNQIQTLRPLSPILPLPSLPIFPMQQRQSMGPTFSPVIDDDCDPIISSSIISVNNTIVSPLLPVVVVTTTPYLALATDLFIGVNNTGLVPFSVVLPANPQTGKVYIVKDVSGTAAVDPITITAVGHTIDGAASATINTNFGSVTLVFNGTEWNII